MAHRRSTLSDQFDYIRWRVEEAGVSRVAAHAAAPDRRAALLALTCAARRACALADFSGRSSIISRQMATHRPPTGFSLAGASSRRRSRVGSSTGRRRRVRRRPVDDRSARAAAPRRDRRRHRQSSLARPVYGCSYFRHARDGLRPPQERDHRAARGGSPARSSVGHRRGAAF